MVDQMGSDNRGVPEDREPSKQRPWRVSQGPQNPAVGESAGTTRGQEPSHAKRLETQRAPLERTEKIAEPTMDNNGDKDSET